MRQRYKMIGGVFTVLLFTVLFLALWGISPFALQAQESEYEVVVNTANPVSDLSKKALKDIYLGKRKSWPDGSKVVVVVNKKSHVHKKFLKRFVNMTPKQFSTFWVKAVFTGTGKPPKELKSAEQVKKYIHEHPKAIGYLASAGMDDTVKKVAIK